MKNITIIPLGTVSPYGKGNHNCPAFLIRYQDFNILLDCGNGSTRLLHFPTDLENLHVFLTHFHSDHIGDIGSLQYASFCHHNLGTLKNKIQIYLPNTDFNFHKAAILNNQESYADYHSIHDYIQYKIGDCKISFQDNHSHTIQSYMIKLETNDFTLVYTSDIGITNISGIIDFSKGADVFICESSFLESHNTNSKTHMTASKAGEIAFLAHVKQLILTHFWPEENPLLYLEEAKKNFLNTDIASEEKKFILKKDS